MSITIYGASDDLIEVEGDIREEFSALGCDKGRAWLALSDGSLFGVRYDEDGVWRILPLFGGRNEFTHKLAPSNDEEDYSDRVTVEGPIDWVVFSQSGAVIKAAAGHSA